MWLISQYIFQILKFQSQLKSIGNVMGIFNHSVVSQISGNQRLKNSIDELIRSCKETGYNSGSIISSEPIQLLQN